MFVIATEAITIAARRETVDEGRTTPEATSQVPHHTKGEVLLSPDGRARSRLCPFASCSHCLRPCTCMRLAAHSYTLRLADARPTTRRVKPH
eukprot:1180299-Prorocentrum_minimum.AAC.1